MFSPILGWVAGEMIGGGFLTSRLSRRIRDEEGMSYGVQALISGHPVDAAGQFMAVAIFAPENVDRVEAALIEELERVIAEGFSQDELDAAKRGWLESRQLSRAQDGNLAGGISQNLYFGRSFEFDAALEEQVRSLTLAEVDQAVVGPALDDPARELGGGDVVLGARGRGQVTRGWWRGERAGP